MNKFMVEFHGGCSGYFEAEFCMIREGHLLFTNGLGIAEDIVRAYAPGNWTSVQQAPKESGNKAA